MGFLGIDLAFRNVYIFFRCYFNMVLYVLSDIGRCGEGVDVSASEG